MSRYDERTLLDTVRWISALMVLFGHTWAALFVREPTVLSRALFALADTRHEWVTLFFVLSGYLVAGGALVRGADRFSLKHYAVARFSRIYIVLLPALALTVALDSLAFDINPASPVHAGPWADGLFGATPPFANYDWSHILFSLLSLEPFNGSTAMGSDGPLWTLGFEWVFYLCFPPLMLLADALGRRLGGQNKDGAVWLMRGVVLVASVAFLVVRHMPYAALLWLIWIGGAVAHLIARTDRWPSVLRWAGLGVCVAGFLLLPRIDYRVADALIGFGFIAFLARFPEGERGLGPRVDKTLASASYSLYVTHLPVVALACLGFIQAGWLHAGGEVIGVRSLAMLAAISVVSLAVSVVFYALFERNTDRLRRAMLASGSVLVARRA